MPKISLQGYTPPLMKLYKEEEDAATRQNKQPSMSILLKKLNLKGAAPNPSYIEMSYFEALEFEKKKKYVKFFIVLIL